MTIWFQFQAKQKNQVQVCKEWRWEKQFCKRKKKHAKQNCSIKYIFFWKLQKSYFPTKNEKGRNFLYETKLRREEIRFNTLCYVQKKKTKQQKIDDGKTANTQQQKYFRLVRLAQTRGRHHAARIIYLLTLKCWSWWFCLLSIQSTMCEI